MLAYLRVCVWGGVRVRVSGAPPPTCFLSPALELLEAVSTSGMPSYNFYFVVLFYWGQTRCTSPILCLVADFQGHQPGSRPPALVCLMDDFQGSK